MQHRRWLTLSIWKMAHFFLQFFSLFSTFNGALSRFSSTVCFNSPFVGFLLLVWVFHIATGENNVFRTGKSESKAKTLAGWSRGRCHAWNCTPRSTWLGIWSWSLQPWRAVSSPCRNSNKFWFRKKGFWKSRDNPLALHKAVRAEQRFPAGGWGQVSDQTPYGRPASSSGGDAAAAEPVPRGPRLPRRAGRGRVYEWIWRNSAMSPRCNCIAPLLLHTHSAHWGTKSWMKRSSCQLRQRQLRKLSHSSFLSEAILSVVSLHTKCGLQRIRQGKIQWVLLLGSKTTGPKRHKGGDKWCMCCRDSVQMLSIRDTFPRFYIVAQQKRSSWAWWFWMSFLCRNSQGSLWRDLSDFGGGRKIPALTYVAHLSGDILNAIYYGSSLQNSLTPHFQGLTASCFDKTLRKA